MASDEGANFWKEELVGEPVASSSAAVNIVAQESAILSLVHHRSPCRVECCLTAP